MIKKYLKYFLYILEHKKNVFIECMKEGLYIHAFTHDMSKFLPSEFFPYARYDFQNKENNNIQTKGDFNDAWEHHYIYNKHHWNYWCLDLDALAHNKIIKLDIPNEMPRKYLKQMICDWKAMSRKFGDTAQAFYLNHYWEIELNRESRYLLEWMLGIRYKKKSYNLYSYSQYEEIYLKTLGELVNENYNNEFFNNNLVPYYKEKFNIDIKEIFIKENDKNE